MNTEERIFYLTSTQESPFLQGVQVKWATRPQDPGVQPVYISQASSTEKGGPSSSDLLPPPTLKVSTALKTPLPKSSSWGVSGSQDVVEMTPGSYCIWAKGAFLPSLPSQDGGEASMQCAALLSFILTPEEREEMKRVKGKNAHLGSQFLFSGWNEEPRKHQAQNHLLLWALPHWNPMNCHFLSEEIVWGCDVTCQTGREVRGRAGAPNSSFRISLPLNNINPVPERSVDASMGLSTVTVFINMSSRY